MKPIVIVLITCLATIVLVRLYDRTMNSEEYGGGPRANWATPPPPPQKTEKELYDDVIAGKLSCKPSDYDKNAQFYSDSVTNKNSYYGELDKIGVLSEYCIAHQNNPPPCPTPPAPTTAKPTRPSTVIKVKLK